MNSLGNSGRWLGLAAVLVVLIVGFYLLSIWRGNRATTPHVFRQRMPTTPSKETDPTAKWRLFEDRYYGYSIKYPPHWFLVPGKKGGATITSYDPASIPATKGLSSTDFPVPPLKIEIYIYSHNKTTTMPLDLWLASLADAPPKEWLKFQKPVVVNGIEGLAQGIEKKHDSGQVFYSSLVVFLPRGEIVLGVESIPDPEMSVHKRTYELILNSLKFTD